MEGPYRCMRMPINELKREKRQWEEKPQRMAKTGMSLTAKILIVAIVAGLLLSAAAFMWPYAFARLLPDSREQAMQEKLEKMYQQQDYSGICTYLEKHNDTI